ncbi:glycoprotein 3-alpha-L-fucosyltransferase A [Lingula anatina]|uniref:Fucosyltransferase n=1 Tax=Lingula anatina TaxID=7574 RepID=A0A1S3JGX9_LINAN|nr:glycoprotein 3-alpha-L-fucosyltransferase A [Lingula anatina]|eukprot:XP_013409401.1 glycoprotein 3-alpha-L-fucosyltransferase A [Lingula anatina]
MRCHLKRIVYGISLTCFLVGIWTYIKSYSGGTQTVNLYQNDALAASAAGLKLILVYTGLPAGMQAGQKQFNADDCPVKNCFVTADRTMASKADAILLMGQAVKPWHRKPWHQIWILYLLESPHHTPRLEGLNNLINWTVSYRTDSTLMAPYGSYVPYGNMTTGQDSVFNTPMKKNYAAGKTKKIAWFVSNCGGDRNGRRRYVDELNKHMPVDIYGGCGIKTCSKEDPRCLDILDRDYKFYLSFENSNCRDYITEKFFLNGLGHDIIPITMGGRPDDYKRAAPPHSYINVDDFKSPKVLAEYLHKLDKNDDLYNEYFRWKSSFHSVNTFFWCRLCRKMHEVGKRKPTWYKNLDQWWRGDGVCSPGRWEDGHSYV